MNRRLNKIPQFARVDELPTGPCCDVHECKGYTSPFGHLPVDRFVRLETRHATPGLLAFVEELVIGCAHIVRSIMLFAGWVTLLFTFGFLTLDFLGPIFFW